ncbi:CesT family type III secretion system chaperone [Pseudomonas sp. D1-1]|uniref:CesT family type III secretion system chaperone n=1 Tax=Pseudomonas sp. D1-1 TaxID=1040793 RepID=UPI003DA833AA
MTTLQIAQRKKMNERYHRLVTDICQLSQIPLAAIDLELVQLSVKGIDFSFSNLADTVMIHADFGPLPVRRREAILLQLMNVNFHLFGGDSPCCFSHNDGTGQVQFSCTVGLTQIGAPQFVQLLGHIAEYAQSWQHSYFLDEGSKREASVRTNLGGL